MRFSLSRENGLQTKKQRGNEILDQNDGSSAQMDSSLKMAELTMERCEELADYLK